MIVDLLFICNAQPFSGNLNRLKSREREIGRIDEESVERENQGKKWETLYFPKGEKA
jgi:hypothetical protein